MLLHDIIVEAIVGEQVDVVAPVDHELAVDVEVGDLWRLKEEVPLKIRRRSDFWKSPVAVGDHLSGSELGLSVPGGAGTGGQTNSGRNIETIILL